MADEIHHPHDLMVRAVLGDVTEAASFLQMHLPGEMSRELNWRTLRLSEGSFVDDDLRGSEAALLYGARRVSSRDTVRNQRYPRFSPLHLANAGSRGDRVFSRRVAAQGAPPKR